MPYNLYYPSVFGDLEKRCCSLCDIYIASIGSAAENRHSAHNAVAAQALRKVRHSRMVRRRVTELLCVSANGLKWLNQCEVEGADYFTENHMNMLVAIVTLETVHEST